MIERLKDWDAELFTLINGSYSDFFDFIFFWASNKFIWIPLYLFFIYLIYKKHKAKGLISLAFIGIALVLCDQGSTHLFKNVFLRLRPCHEPSLQTLIHFFKDSCGGKYGFLSAHAANSFAVACFLHLYIGKDFKYLRYILAFWLIIIAYSRVYLGVHYPGDVLFGALFGTAVGIILFKLYLLYSSRFYKSSHE